MTTPSRDIVERLEEYCTHMVEGSTIFCQVPEADLRVAITEIKFLRKAAGAVSQGPGFYGASFAEITKDLPRRSTEPPDPS